MASVVAAFFIHGWINAPTPNAVNGTYYNACCGNVVMRDGTVWYKKDIYKYKLMNIKFRLRAYVQGNFTERGITPSSDESLLIFFDENGKRGFETWIRGRVYSFIKIK